MFCLLLRISQPLWQVNTFSSPTEDNLAFPCINKFAESGWKQRPGRADPNRNTVETLNRGGCRVEIGQRTSAGFRKTRGRETPPTQGSHETIRQREAEAGCPGQVTWGRWSGFSRSVQVHRSPRWTAEFTVRVDYSEHTQDEISGQKNTGGVDVQRN